MHVVIFDRTSSGEVNHHLSCLPVNSRLVYPSKGVGGVYSEEGKSERERGRDAGMQGCRDRCFIGIHCVSSLAVDSSLFDLQQHCSQGEPLRAAGNQ